MAFVSALLLVVFLLLRPMELWPEIASLHSLEVLSTITAIGIVAELLDERRAAGSSPQLPWLAGFLVWAYAVSIARLGLDDGLRAGWSITLGPLFMLLVMFALTKLSRLRGMAKVLLACGVLVSVVAVHQGSQPRQCIELHELPLMGEKPEFEPLPEGRECQGTIQCEADGVGESDYLCERVGLFGTMSTQGRVRWRGQLDDPNELAIVVAALIPFAFMFGRGRRLGTLAVVGVVLVVGLWAIVLTQSRGGQLVLGTVMVCIMVRRLGWWSVVFGVAATLPLILLSWRGDADAASSSVERAEILSEGLQMLKANPLFGIGVSQFAAENPLNMAAHNSYLLIAAEVGIPGYLLWCGLVWMSVKIPLTVALRPPQGIDPAVIPFAEALAASTIALHVGIFFLSFVYKHVFFVWLALPGALYGTVREAQPEFRVRFTQRDLAGICVFASVALTAVRVAALHAR